MKELIKTYLADIIRKLAPDFKGDILVEIPENKENGDYSTNIAFLLAKIMKRLPKEIAEDLAKKLRTQKITDFQKIEAVGGFINFFLSRGCLGQQVKEILKAKSKYGWTTFRQAQGKKIQIEFISANPTGPLTMANARGGFWGDVLANIIASQGHIVRREYYINDRGEQVLALGRSVKLSQGFKVEDSENVYKGEYIKDLAKKINKKLSVEESGQKAVELILKTYIKPVVEKMLKIKFNKWFSEKSLYKGGLYEKVFATLVAKNLVYEKDGATWMRTSRLGDTEDRVLIKKDGNETYFLSDILYHWDKFNIRKFNEAIDIWGADHHGYAPRLVAALSALGIDKERLHIISTQMVRLIKGGKEFKISKRAGTFVTVEELVGEVGLDSARYFFLSLSPNTHLDFNIDLAKERSEKNPVYYIQYAHARLSSILRKARKTEILNPKSEIRNKSKILNSKSFEKQSELNLMRKLIELPELLADVAENYEVHRLSRYALELARQVSAFYRDVPVLRASGQEKAARLALVAATKIVLANTLNLMGIKAPDKM